MHETFYFPSFYVNAVLTGWHTSPQSTTHIRTQVCVLLFSLVALHVTGFPNHTHRGRTCIRTTAKKMRCDFDKSKKIRFECVYLYQCHPTSVYKCGTISKLTSATQCFLSLESSFPADKKPKNSQHLDFTSLIRLVCTLTWKSPKIDRRSCLREKPK